MDEPVLETQTGTPLKPTVVSPVCQQNHFCLSQGTLCKDIIAVFNSRLSLCLQNLGQKEWKSGSDWQPFSMEKNLAFLELKVKCQKKLITKREGPKDIINKSNSLLGVGAAGWAKDILSLIFCLLLHTHAPGMIGCPCVLRQEAPCHSWAQLCAPPSPRPPGRCFIYLFFSLKRFAMILSL